MTEKATQACYGCHCFYTYTLNMQCVSNNS